MKILQVLNFSSEDARYGGPQRVCESQIASLRSYGEKVELLSLTTKESSIASDGRNMFEARRFFGKASFGSLWSIRAINFAFRNIKSYDIVHLHISRDFITLPTAIFCVWRKVPLVLQPHGMLQDHSGFRRKIFDLMLKVVFQRASKILVLTEEEKRDIEIHYKPNAQTVQKIYNGSNLKNLEHQDVQIPRRDTILFASRLDPRKRATEFIDAAILLKDKHPTWRFALAGSDAGSLSAVLSKLEEAASERILYLGSLEKPELRALFDRTLILAHPALWDVFPMIMVEAACAGVPVVAVEGYEISDWFYANGAAELSDGTVASLAESIEVAALNFPLLTKSTYKFASRHLDENVIAKQLSKLYKSILEAQRG